MEALPKVPCLFREKDRRWTMRRRVPDDIRSIIGRSEVWKTYGAVTFEQARRLHSMEMAKLDAVFAEARRRAAMSEGSPPPAEPQLAEPSEVAVRAAVLRWFYDAEVDARLGGQLGVTLDDADEVLENLRIDQAHLEGPDGEALAERRLGAVFSAFGFAAPVGRLRRLAIGLIQSALVEGNRRAQSGLGGLPTGQRGDPLFAGISALSDPPAAPEAIAKAAVPDPIASLSAEELLTTWAAERQPSQATLRKYRTSFAHVARVLGFDDVRRIRPENVVTFKAERLREGRDPGTVADDVLACGAVCKWAVANRMLLENPFAGMAPKVSRRGRQSRDGYDDDDAARILTAARSEVGWLRWLPWLLCFTGARISEIVEMRRADVRQDDGTWVLDLKPSVERAGKNEVFQRMIPLHPALEAEGFLTYVAGLPDTPGTPLFPDLTARADGTRTGPATTIHCRWVHRTVGITDPRKAPAHSWRHRMEDQLRKVRALPELQDAITGRHNPRNAGAGYGKGFRGMPYEVLKELQKVPSPVEG